MKNILFFVTHKTLGLDHADMCLKHLGRSYDPLIFDEMYIYNSHQEELSNNVILDLTKKYNINNICKDIKIFPYDNNTSKTLGGDCVSIFNYLLNNHYSCDDRILLLKSDIMVSINVLNELKNVQNSLDEKFILTPPFITAKERVTNDEILEYTSRKNIILSDEITFFDETEDGNKETTDHGKRDPKDETIKFISCTGKADFSCHYFSIHIIWNMIIHEKTWGGMNFSNCKDFWRGTNYSFTVHKYHSIKSDNRSTEREGPINEIFLS